MSSTQSRIRRALRWSHYGTTALRWFLEWTILVVIALGIVAFYVRWWPAFHHPGIIFAQLRDLLNDLFWLILLIEVRDLLNRISVPRLLDIVATVLARKLVLEVHAPAAFIETGALVLVVAARLAWSRWAVASAPRS
ncbi:conserved protein of unknown function [Candidatus Hydrogenisulfobacillus filiaventi]|uniref:Transporter n=1 Tax=Candidatus Hydrogenisulfobacillus filiaventi TaxID=2707344 RepID=A0A6F8ZH64_9FIRM|nr:hypothetical protein [Bacillota bacterium]CAB1129019.1 conserved protein of unknown function [Candidatus Hydrogenisulfobacillus filiaventi]